MTSSSHRQLSKKYERSGSAHAGLLVGMSSASEGPKAGRVVIRDVGPLATCLDLARPTNLVKWKVKLSILAPRDLRSACKDSPQRPGPGISQPFLSDMQTTSRPAIR
jgi:hypothetical protein